MNLNLGLHVVALTYMIRVVGAVPACAASSFKSLVLPEIEVTALIAKTTSITTGPGGEFTELQTNTTLDEIAAATQICQIMLQYTHPGQADTVNTFIGLPLTEDAWNQRYQMPGGSGWMAGALSTIYTAVAGGYASSSTNGGHIQTAATADWGLVSPGNTNWPALWDFSGAALDEAASLGKLAAELYFGSPPVYSYWNGCSTGGRQGHNH
jgi:hypothetical protein